MDGEPEALEPAPRRQPTIIINPTTFHNKKDALCVAWNEGLRVFMELNEYEPTSEPTDSQRKFFSTTPYADDELQLRRTILARIATFDTSVKDPTDEQLEETAGILDAVVETGFAKTDDEIAKCRRLSRAVRAAVGAEPIEPPAGSGNAPVPLEPSDPGTQGLQSGGTTAAVLDESKTSSSADTTSSDPNANPELNPAEPKENPAEGPESKTKPIVPPTEDNPDRKGLEDVPVGGSEVDRNAVKPVTEPAPAATPENPATNYGLAGITTSGVGGRTQYHDAQGRVITQREADKLAEQAAKDAEKRKAEENRMAFGDPGGQSMILTPAGTLDTGGMLTPAMAGVETDDDPATMAGLRPPGLPETNTRPRKDITNESPPASFVRTENGGSGHWVDRNGRWITKREADRLLGNR